MPDDRTEPADGDREARALLDSVYAELRVLAHRAMKGEGAPATLQTTALVHEAWLRLEREGRASWSSRAQFFVAAATAMRRILVDRARARSRLKRGGDRARVDWNEGVLGNVTAAEDDPRELVDLDLALDELREFDAGLARVVELRAFAGLTEDEVAQTLSRSTRSVRRDWRAARLWLHRRIRALRADGSDERDEPDERGARDEDGPGGRSVLRAV